MKGCAGSMPGLQSVAYALDGRSVADVACVRRICTFPESVPTARVVPFCTHDTDEMVSFDCVRSHNFDTKAL